jgi:uncharacterized protein YjiS (DUF1127 family)
MTEISTIKTTAHRDVAATVGLFGGLATAPLHEAKRDAIIRLSAFAAVSALRVGRWLSLRIFAASATLVQLAAQIQKRCNQRRGFRELYELDDRLLKDIGIGRSEILHLVHCSTQTHRRNES